MRGLPLLDKSFGLGDVEMGEAAAGAAQATAKFNAEDILRQEDEQLQSIIHQAINSARSLAADTAAAAASAVFGSSAGLEEGGDGPHVSVSVDESSNGFQLPAEDDESEGEGDDKEQDNSFHSVLRKTNRVGRRPKRPKTETLSPAERKKALHQVSAKNHCGRLRAPAAVSILCQFFVA